MYTLSSWRSHLGIVAVDLLHHEPARTVGDPLTAYISGKVTHVSRLTNVHPKFLEKSPGYRSFRPSAKEPARTLGEPFTVYVPGEVTQISRMTNVHPEFLEMSHGYRGCLLGSKNPSVTTHGTTHGLHMLEYMSGHL